MEIDLDENLSLGHLLLSDRECRTCRETKNLECKKCTIKRVKSKKFESIERWQYPDW